MPVEAIYGFLGAAVARACALARPRRTSATIVTPLPAWSTVEKDVVRERGGGLRSVGRTISGIGRGEGAEPGAQEGVIGHHFGGKTLTLRRIHYGRHEVVV
jgi:hypothetical protein